MEIEQKVNSVVLPGDIVGKISELKMRLGPGIDLLLHLYCSHNQVCYKTKTI